VSTSHNSTDQLHHERIEAMSQTKRILFYSHTRLTSGAERMLLTLIAALDRTLYVPLAVCPRAGAGNLDTLLEAQNVPVLTGPLLQARFTLNPFRLMQYLVSVTAAILSLRGVIRRAAPDLLHANSVRAGLIATCATAFMKTPVLWHIHDDLPDHPISRAIRWFAFHSRRSRFVAVSKTTAEAFAADYAFGYRLAVLYNAIDTGRFPSKRRPLDAEAAAIRTALNLPEEDILVSVVGMLNPRKRVEELIQAFAEAAKQNHHLRLAVVGAAIFNDDHLYAERLYTLVKTLELGSHVYFLGSRADVPAILRASDVLVLNAGSEPFGLVLVEAMSSGTAVLAAAVGGVPEIVSNGETGLLVSAAAREELTRSLLQLAGDSSLRHRLAANALFQVVPRFSLETYTPALRAFYKQLFHPRNNPLGDAAPPRVAVFHDNFCQMGGAERVAEHLHKALQSVEPTALHSTLSAFEILTPHLRKAGISNTWMQHLPARAKLFRAYFLLYPIAIDGVDLSAYDVVVSSCFGYAKGVRKRTDALHICYCHTPMRWVWRTQDYLSREKSSKLKTLALALPLRWLKRWEIRAARQPDAYIANSYVVAERLKLAFDVDATVIPPPIDTLRFAPLPGHEEDAPEDFYLVLSRLVPYKRFDLAIAAAGILKRRLVLIGDGPDRARLETLARGNPLIQFLGRAPDDVVADYARRTRGLIFPGEEDFGMTPLEVNAAGRPVIAFRAGGAEETVVEGLSGVFFDTPDAAALAAAMVRSEEIEWNHASIRAHAESYSIEKFDSRIRDFVAQASARHRNVRPATIA